MKKDNSKSKLQLNRQSIRALSSDEVKQIRGGARPTTQPCCDLGTELLNPFTCD
jgi:hypothetical protein